LKIIVNRICHAVLNNGKQYRLIKMFGKTWKTIENNTVCYQIVIKKIVFLFFCLTNADIAV